MMAVVTMEVAVVKIVAAMIIAHLKMRIKKTCIIMIQVMKLVKKMQIWKIQYQVLKIKILLFNKRNLKLIFKI